MQLDPNGVPGQVIVYLLCFHSNDTGPSALVTQNLPFTTSAVIYHKQIDILHNDTLFHQLYYYMSNFCNLIGLEK